MSNRSSNWLKFGGLVGLAFVLGLFFAGLLDFPRTGYAQQDIRPGHGPLATVDPPRIPGAQSLSDLSEAYAAVVEAVRPSVVFITSEQPASRVNVLGDLPPGLEQLIPPQARPRQNQQRRQPQAYEESSGSGFIVSSDGYILTNNHVVDGATRINVRLIDGRTFPARVVGTDKDTDVGVLKIDAKGLTPAALGASDKVRVGEWVLAIGNPLGDNLTFSVTQGIVSAKGRGRLNLPSDGGDVQRQIQDFIQTDAAINKGNSGGPLVNVRGEVIGINSAIASATGYYQGYAFAVPIDLARRVMDQIIAYGKVQRTSLGILVNDADAADAAYLGLPSISGVKVSSFPPDADSPAKRAGILPGDVITAVDGQPIQYVAQLQQAVGFRHPGESVRVEVARKDGKHEFTVRLSGLNVADSTAPAAVEQPDNSASTGVGKKLGLTLEPMTTDIARDLGLAATTRGLLVESIGHDSPAQGKLCPTEAQGACDPDVITEVEGKPVRTEKDLLDGLTLGRNGVVTLTVINKGGDSRVVRLLVNR